MKAMPEKDVERVVKGVERATKGTGTVLLVDDEEIVLEVNKALLEDLGYRVIIARGFFGPSTNWTYARLTD